MGKQRKLSTATVTPASIKKINTSELMKVGNVALPEIFQTFESAESEFFPGIVQQCLIAIYTILVLLQLRLSTTATNTTVDGSASYKLYKRRIISNFPGRVLCASISISN